MDVRSGIDGHDFERPSVTVSQGWVRTRKEPLYRRALKRWMDVGFVLMVATTLHSIATGNILPAWIPCVCVDISPSVLTKLADRGSWQTIGLVTDVEPFFRELLHEIEVVEKAGK